MWIVKIALERPYTFIVLALLILILSPVVILNTPTDIFPEYQHSGCGCLLDLHGHESRRVGGAAHDRL